jgi:hypothetical protein
MARWAGRMAGVGLTRPWPDPGRHVPQPAVRVDPLTQPVAITEHCVIGDQIRLPATWCDMVGCRAVFADPAALGEADNRARALVASWALDAFGRVICPVCQRHHPASVRLAPQPDPGTAGGHQVAAAATRPGSGASRSARSAAGRQPRVPGLGRHRRGAQWPGLLAALASDHND